MNDKLGYFVAGLLVCVIVALLALLVFASGGLVAQASIIKDCTNHGAFVIEGQRFKCSPAGRVDEQ